MYTNVHKYLATEREGVPSKHEMELVLGQRLM